MDEPENAQDLREEVHAMDVDVPENAISTAPQATEPLEEQPPVEQTPEEGLTEVTQSGEALMPMAAPVVVSEGISQPEAHAAVVSEQVTEEAIVDQPATPSDAQAIQFEPVQAPESTVPPTLEQSPEVPTGDEIPQASSDPSLATAQTEAQIQSPSLPHETHVQEDEQDASPNPETGFVDSLIRPRPNIDNQQVLAALNNALAYRDSRDDSDEEPQNDVLFLQDDEAERAATMKPLHSARSTFTEDSALTSLGPQDGVMSAGFHDSFDLASGSGGRTGEKSLGGEADDEGLADYSTPQSRFAGVFLDIVPDRRKLRYYVPGPEIKRTTSLKVTLKRPDGWIPKAFPPPVEVIHQEETFTSSGRKTRRRHKSYYEDLVILDRRRAALSERRKGKQREEGSEVTHAEEPAPRGRKVSESADYTIPVDEESPQDQDVSDNYSNVDSVSEVPKRQKRETMEPSRRSRRIPEKSKRAQWGGMDDDEVRL